MAQSKIMTLAFFRQMFAATSAALTAMSSGCWTGWPSPAIPNLYRRDAELVMDDEEVSWMVAMMDIGILVTPLPTGYMMNRFGRKKIILCAGVLFVLSWVLVAVAYSAWFLYTARFIAGLAAGMSLTVLPIYLAEIASVSIRGTLSTILNIFIWIGITFEFVVGSFVSFKVLALLSVIPSVLLLLTFPFMPESPYFLYMKDRDIAAFESLRWLRGSSGNPPEKDIADVKEWIDQDRQNKRRFCNLFLNAENRRAVLITLGLTVFQRSGGSFALVAYSSSTLPPTRGSFGPSEVMIVFAVVSVLTNLLLASLIDRLGRRPMLLFSTAGTSLLRGFDALYYYIYRETSVDTNSFMWVPYACVLLSAVTQTGLGSIPFTLHGELLPTSLKSQANALCTIMSALAAFLVDKLYVTVETALGVYVNYLFFGVNEILCFIFILVFVFETTGKSFAEIQIMLRKTTNKSTSNNNN